MLGFGLHENRLRKLQRNLLGRYKEPFSLDGARRIEVGGYPTPTLRNGERQVNADHTVVDDYSKETGGGATIFVRDDDSFVRIVTTVRDANGARPLGGTLDHSHPSYRLLLAGHEYIGYTRSTDKKFLSLFSPIFDSRNTVIGATITGVDISSSTMPSLALKLSCLITAWAATLVVGREIVADSLAGSKATSFATFGAILSAIVIPMIGVGTYVLIRRKVSLVLHDAEAAAQRLAQGDLTTQMPVDRGDEIGRVLEALNGINVGLAGLVGNVRGTTNSLTNSSHEIAAGNMDLSARTEEQAASLEETAASMTQLTETVKQNADNAREANSLATNATEMAESGNDAVQSMVVTIGKISASSSKISEITGVIEGIAFQTNILALNAAVEAARAGEQGRGFAVVASEVRSLAQRSATAAKEIKELIGASVTTIEDGAQQASEVGVTMGQIKQAIKQVSDIVGEIATASEEQSRGIEQISQAVSEMDEVTQQNAALVEQAAAASQSLEQQATQLKGAVSLFKVADAGLAAARVAAPRTEARLPALSSSLAERVSPEKSSATTKTRSISARKTTVVSAESKGDDWQTF
ncbi:MAG: methyl-accepting chemotaxis protein [Paraburkholderia sp.]